MQLRGSTNAACSENIPLYCIESGGSRTVPRAGSATAQDDIVKLRYVGVAAAQDDIAFAFSIRLLEAWASAR